MTIDPKLRRDLEALLPFLDVFQKPGFRYAGRPTRLRKEAKNTFAIEPPTYTRPVQDFFRAVQAVGDPTYDPATAGEIAERPFGIETADLTAIRRLFTLAWRSERFGEGNWLAWLEGGTVVRALRRLAELLAEDATPARLPFTTVSVTTNAGTRRGELALTLTSATTAELTYRAGRVRRRVKLPGPVVAGLVAGLAAVRVPVAAPAGDGVHVRVDFGFATYAWAGSPPAMEPLAGWVRRLAELAAVYAGGVADPTRPFVVADAALEGGGFTLFAAWHGAGWRYLQKGTTIDLDDDGVDFWRSWESAAYDHLEPLVSEYLPVMYPLDLHPLVAERLLAAAEAFARVRPELPFHSEDSWRRTVAAVLDAAPVPFPPAPLRRELLGAKVPAAEPDEVKLEWVAPAAEPARKPATKTKSAQGRVRPKRK